jgi:hypothetical protein
MAKDTIMCKILEKAKQNKIACFLLILALILSLAAFYDVLQNKSDMATAMATMVLVVITGFYAWNTHLQIETMKEQTERTVAAMGDQVNATNRQASTMAEALNVEQLVKKRERLEKELRGIVGPLYNNKDELILFLPQRHNNERERMRLGYDLFWQKIKDNKYLIPDNLEALLTNLMLVIENHIEIEKSSGPENWNKTREQYKDMLMAPLGIRHKELIRQIQEIEQKLGWRK